jgi:hypothetical protein
MRRLLLSALALGLLFALGSVASGEVALETRCGDIRSYDIYNLRVHALPCKTTRRVAQAFVDHGGKPFNFRCVIKKSYPMGAVTRCHRINGKAVFQYNEYSGR